MLPIILGGIALVGAGLVIYNELEEQSSAARGRWHSKHIEVQRSIEWHEEQIENHLDEAKQSYDFKTLIDIHYSCVKVADQAYTLLKDARTSLDKIGEALVKTQEQRKLLFTKKKELKDKDEIKKQRDEFLSRVKELNGKTHTLKISIKERTGSKGRDWYEKLEVRKQLRTETRRKNVS